MSELLSLQSLKMALECDNTRCNCQRSTQKNIMVHCPAHVDKTPSLHLSEVDGKILWHCHAGCSQEAVQQALEKRGIWQVIPLVSSENNSVITAIYDYVDSSGSSYFQVVRRSNKSFLQRRPYRFGWIWGLTEGEYGQKSGSSDWYKIKEGQTYEKHHHFEACVPIPYHLHSLIKSDTVYVVEGEKDVDNLMKCGVVATCNPGGAGKWRERYNTYFINKHIIILPDNDVEGHRHAQLVAEHLHGTAASVKVIKLPDLSKKEDVSNWLHKGGTREILEKLVNQMDEWKPQGKEQEDQNNSMDEIEDWILETRGNFTSRELYVELHLKTKEEKKRLRNKLNYLVKQGDIERTGNKNGVFCKINKITYVDFKNSDSEELFDIEWPLRLHDFVQIPKKSIVIVAGVPNAGKTTFLFNVIHANMQKYHNQIVYLSSETSTSTAHRKILSFKSFPVDEWHFKMVDCQENWHQKIHPNMLNIVDYLEIHDEFYKIGNYIQKIHNALGEEGIAIIALQKNAQRDMGKGGFCTLEKAQLYLSLNSSSLTIVKSKHWTSKKDPHGLTFNFKLDNGARFVSTKEPYYRKLQL